MNKPKLDRDFIPGFDDLGEDDLYYPNPEIPLWPRPDNDKDYLDVLLKMKSIGYQEGLVHGDTSIGTNRNNFRKTMLAVMRATYPDYWSYKKLADLFDISTRRVGQLLEQKDQILKKFNEKFDGTKE